MDKMEDPKYPNIEHPKVQSAGSSIRRNKVDPGLLGALYFDILDL